MEFLIDVTVGGFWLGWSSLNLPGLAREVDRFGGQVGPIW